MTAGWLLYSLAIGVLLAASAFLSEAALRMIGRPARWVWLAALAGTLLLSAVAPVRYAVGGSPVVTQVTVDGEIGTAIAGATRAASTGVVAALRAAQVYVDGAMRSASQRLSPVLQGETARGLALAWAVMSGLLATVLAVSTMRVWRARRGWPVGEVQGVRVRVAPSLGPLVMGVVRPEIILPRWLLASPPAEQRLVLAHEQEHVRSLDPQLLVLGWLTAILLPWHPVVWWMLARLRLAVELDCDARVVRAGADRGAYGSVLLDVAQRRTTGLIGAPALLDPTSQLERRLLMMTHRSPRHARVWSLGLATVAGGLVLAACAADMPTAAEIETMDVAALEQRVLLAGPLGAVEGEANVQYFIDDEEVTAEAARALAPDQITSVAVLRHRGEGSEPSVVKIYTGERGDVAALAGLPAPPGEGHILVGTVRRDREQGLGPDEVVRSIVREQGEDGRDRVVIRGVGPGAQPVFILVDGDQERRIPQSEMTRIRPGQIESIEVLKEGAATARYDYPEAANGVVRIKLRAAGSADPRGP